MSVFQRVTWFGARAAFIAFAATLLFGCATDAPSAKPPPQIAVKVLIISMFKPEAQVWFEPLKLTREIKVPGLSSDDPLVRCNADSVCQVTTGMGHTNAAASITALVFSGKFDLSKTYFLVAGIAGVDPNVSTIGSATWARFLVDFGIAHEIDAREMPSTWRTGYFGIGAKDPDSKPKFEYRTEVFRLNEKLLQKALKLSANAALADNDKARAYRARYSQPTAKARPSVLQCDTAAGDTYWHGRFLGETAARWVSLVTDGQGKYCTTQQEDNATYEALKRGASAGLLDLQRVAVLRTASNFDRPYQGQTAYASLNAESGGFPISTGNLLIAGRPLVDAIVGNWPAWSAGVPAD
ncbi:purine-nucleoside phosphorylase [Variovorax sp. GB1P17]|uniref:purine-nucleoside phosphorylase n=1 Tax=Variovorax sp. GB1P17 TaxID=3443740 RepID=UPI003F46D889